MYDYLIVGQGVAGTSLAHLLLERGRKVLVVSDSTMPSSSGVAAGIFNPLTGKKLVKTWLADDLFPAAASFYRRMEGLLSASFYHPLRMYRPFRSVGEQNDYLALASEASISPYVDTNPDHTAYVSINAPLGGLEVKRAGWVDLPAYLERSRLYFSSNGLYRNEKFNTADMSVGESGVVWKEMTFSKVILCQGVFAREDPYFGWLPFNPVKGQVLDLSMKGYAVKNMVNQGVFLLPQKDGLVRAGATYSWHDLDWEISEDGRRYLEEKLKPLLHCDYEVVRQRAGIRPSVKDRRPLIGLHPEYKKVGVFNGFGTKGVTLVPFFALQYIDYLEENKEIDSEVNIERYFSLFYQSNSSES